jgi:UDP-glucose 4-epimerase
LHGEALPVENGGVASRDFIYVEDMARGLMACALSGEPGEIYNLASGAETSILDLAKRVNSITGNKTPIALAPARDWDKSGQRFGDPAKAREKLGFVASVAHEDGTSRTVEWTRKNRERILGCMRNHVSHVPDIGKYS